MTKQEAEQAQRLMEEARVDIAAHRKMIQDAEKLIEASRKVLDDYDTQKEAKE